MQVQGKSCVSAGRGQFTATSPSCVFKTVLSCHETSELGFALVFAFFEIFKHNYTARLTKF